MDAIKDPAAPAVHDARGQLQVFVAGGNSDSLVKLVVGGSVVWVGTLSEWSFSIAHCRSWTPPTRSSPLRVA